VILQLIKTYYLRLIDYARTKSLALCVPFGGSAGGFIGVTLLLNAATIQDQR
jgi:hypothetical protein